MDEFTKGLLARIRATESDLARARDTGDDFLVEVEQAELDELRLLAEQHANVMAAAGASGSAAATSLSSALPYRPAPTAVSDTVLEHENSPARVQRARHAALLKEACPPVDAEASAAKLRALAQARGIDVDAQAAAGSRKLSNRQLSTSAVTPVQGSGTESAAAAGQGTTAGEEAPADGSRLLPDELAGLAAMAALVEQGKAEGHIAADDLRRALEADQVPATQWKNVVRALNAVLDAHGVTLMVSQERPRARRRETTAPQEPRDDVRGQNL